MRAGHTEAGCDLAAMAGLTPAAVICEIMKDDGTMARLPDLQLFAAEHGLKIGTIADLIEHRSRNESLDRESRRAAAAHGLRRIHRPRLARQAQPGRAPGAGQGRWTPTDVPVRVHEPLSVLDALESAGHALLEPGREPGPHRARRPGRRRAAQLRRDREQLLAQFDGTASRRRRPKRGSMDLRTYGIGRRSCANAACTA
jgi:3,4-dihydroxy 2-butanone 4-phosphate synthase/GTP cyclohydrolase II